MEENRFERVQSLFLAAQDIEPRDREVWLQDRCGGDQSLVADVKSLLGHDERTADPLEGGVEMPETLARAGIQQLAEKLAPTIRYFGNYELVQELARGGMGVVYKANQTNLDRVVALKMILAGKFASEEAIQRFHIEAAAAANLDHPGIVPIFEVGEHDGHHYYSMGFVEGKSLQDFLRDGPLPFAEAVELCIPIAEAIQYAHEQGVIHRDLKPSNVLVDTSGQPRVADFGLAKRTDSDSGLTADGVFGTPSYMPPEQATKAADANEAADVYSLGGILYALLTGRPPFQAGSHAETILQVLENDPVAVHELNPSVPKDLETIAHRALQKQPSKRYATAQAFADDLRLFRDGKPIHARPVGPFERTVKWCRRYPIVAALFVTTTVFGVLGFMYASIAESRRQTAQSAANNAQSQRANAVAISDYLTKILRSPDPSIAQGQEVTAAWLLDNAADDLQTQHFTPEVESQIRLTIGNAYQTLGELRKASSHLEHAVALSRDTDDRLKFAGMLLDLAGCQMDANDFDKAIAAAKEAIQIYEQEDHFDLRTVEAHRTIGTGQLRLGDLSAARKNYERAVELSSSMKTDALALQKAKSLSRLGLLEVTEGNNGEAAQCFDETLRIRQQRLPASHPLIATSMMNLADAVGVSDPDRAIGLMLDALAIHRKLLPKDHPDIALTLEQLGALSLQQKDLENSESYFAEAIELRRDRGESYIPALVADYYSLAYVRILRGKDASNLLDALRQLADRSREPGFRSRVEAAIEKLREMSTKD